MARRRKTYVDRRQSDGHERWLISYADFITLMFAVFVVLYAVSSLSEAKYKRLSQAIGEAFGAAVPSVAGAPGRQPATVPGAHKAAAPGGNGGDAAGGALRELAQHLTEAMAPLVASGDARVLTSPGGIRVELNAGLLFKSGEAQLQEDSKHLMETVAMVLVRNGSLPVQVEGHTDDVPVAGVQFPSNWELSSARASSVVRALVDGGVDPRRLVAKGYAEYQPLESNATTAGRARNRRVVLSILAAPDSPAPPASAGPAQPPAIVLPPPVPQR
ncbi:MAG TPA: OmpA family protein [Burkholderiales bacterium]|nr:OmpA family protein [Burkholderiales bacterium]